MAFVPLLLMIFASMPPLRSALVNRYIMPSAAFTVAFLGVTIALTIGTRKKWNKTRSGAACINGGGNGEWDCVCASDR